MTVALDPLKAPEWMLQGSCRNSDAHENFFPAKGESTREARQLCQGCPVSAECLDYAIIFNMTGIWGGTTLRERNKRYPSEIQQVVRDDYFGG